MTDVCTDDVVEEMSIDEAEITVDGGCCSTSKGPGIIVVMRHASIGVLKESDGNCEC